MKQKSEIDELYYRVMGYYPEKAGKAYEIISTALLSKLTDLKGQHDVFLKGLSGSKYQLDGMLDDNVMIEAKDYTVRDGKVGRGDMQKMQGGLTDLSVIEKGIFTSATEFTSDAQKYAYATSSNSLQKEIIPASIRLSTPSDLAKRINTICINMTVSFPDFDKGEYSVDWAPGEIERLNHYMIQENRETLNYNIDFFYDKDGNIISSMEDLSYKQQPNYDLSSDAKELRGRFAIDGYIKVEGLFYHITGIDYKIPINKSTEKFFIKANGTPEMLVKCDKLGINKLMTDEDLKAAIQKVVKQNK